MHSGLLYKKVIDTNYQQLIVGVYMCIYFYLY
jgi:hypothetical protein